MRGADASASPPESVAFSEGAVDHERVTTQIQGAAESLNDRHGLTSALRNAVVRRALTRFGVYKIQSIGASLFGEAHHAE